VLVASSAGLASGSTPQRKTFAPGSPKCGQELPISANVCQKEFKDWRKDEKRWREGRERFANYARYMGERIAHVKRPDPPAWIEPYCKQDPARQFETRATEICLAYDDYVQYDWTQHIDGPRAGVTYSKRTVQTIGDHSGFTDFLLRNLHYDGFWTNGFSKPRALGLFGTHLTLANAGRIYLWGPPGMLIVRRPEGKIDVKMTYGVDIFLGDLPNPFRPEKKMPVYFSVAKVFGKPEAAAIKSGVRVGLDMAGFSVTLGR